MTLTESFKRITGQTLIVTPKHGGKSEQYEVLVDNHYRVNLFTLAECPIIPDDMKIILILMILFSENHLQNQKQVKNFKDLVL